MSSSFRLTAAFLMICIASSATAQRAKDIEGAWILVSSINEVDGRKTDQFGPHPNGMLTLGSNGRFMLTIIGAGLPRFASNNRANGTPEENKEVVSRSIAMIGSYVVDAGGSTLTLRTENATFPNWDGTEQRRSIVTLNAEELKYVTPSASGGGVGTVTWKRAH
jgi:hypothetical protein